MQEAVFFLFYYKWSIFYWIESFVAYHPGWQVLRGTIIIQNTQRSHWLIFSVLMPQSKINSCVNLFHLGMVGFCYFSDRTRTCPEFNQPQYSMYPVHLISSWQISCRWMSTSCWTGVWSSMLLLSQKCDTFFWMGNLTLRLVIDLPNIKQIHIFFRSYSFWEVTW